MAYVTGIANSLADLLAALQGACTANGWTLRGSVLSKGSCYVSVTVAGGYLVVLGGTGIDGSNALTGSGPNAWRVGAVWTGDTLTFPITYAIHIAAVPDEVYVLVNYEVVRWQWAAFGSSPVAGLPGSGNWYGATARPTTPGAAYKFGMNPTTASGTPNTTLPALFWNKAGYDGFNGAIHHALDGGQWSSGVGYDAGAGLQADAISPASTGVSRQPNVWNGESILLPIQPCLARGASKVSMLCDLAHARYLRNDNYADGDIVTLGADRWRVYPWAKKNAGVRDGGSNVDHSGTFGWAIRYDGP